jgi:hypothetical protein
MSLNAYHVLAGTVSLRKQGTEVRQQWAGQSPHSFERVR